MDSLHITARPLHFAGVGTCVFSGVSAKTSVVGYVNNTATGESASLGPVFKACGTAGTSYKLSDFTVSDVSPTEDCIQFLDTATANTYLSATFIDPAVYGDDLGGWWDYDDIGGTELNDETFAAGTAFLCLFTSGNTITFNCAGEVEKGAKQIVIDSESPFICNPLPVDLTLSQITVANMSPTEDCFQYLDVDTANTYLSVTYIDPETYGDDLGGWWDYDDIGGTEVNDQPLGKGEGILGLMTSGNEMTVVFPAILAD